MRLGLCCTFLKQNIKFKKTTIKHLNSLSKHDAYRKISGLCVHNANTLLKALQYCQSNNIGCFRVNSDFLPAKTHPEYKYEISDLQDSQYIFDALQLAKNYAHENNIRMAFHPDQFVVLNSPVEKIVENSISEIEYQSHLAKLIGADVVNIHAGGQYQDKKSSLDRFFKNLSRLSDVARSVLTVENDDLNYNPEDLLFGCMAENIPLVYDIHHHRCNQDSYTNQQASDLSMKTWNREPLFHISSPSQNYSGDNKSKYIRSHHDYIQIEDFPFYWKNANITIEIEAKFKEVAIKKLQQDLNK